MAVTVIAKTPPLMLNQNQSSTLPQLRSNRGSYVEAEHTAWLRPTTLDTPLEQMRRSFDEDGYLFLQGLLPREEVWKAREHYFTMMQATHLLKPGSNPREGIFDDSLDPLSHQSIGGELSSEKSRLEILLAAHNTPEYLAFARHPVLREFVRKFMGWADDVECERTLLRHNVPYSNSTGIHYDKIFLRAGEAEFLTAWVPIGDCAANGGGLIYLEDSTELGMEIERDFSLKALALSPEERISAYNRHMTSNGTLSQDAAAFAEEIGKGRRWLAADYQAGDVVFHNPYMIHTSGKNEDKLGRIRLSTDLRFYEKGAAMDERWMTQWEVDDGL